MMVNDDIFEEFGPVTDDAAVPSPRVTATEISAS